MAMTAHEAVDALQDVADYEERLTARAHGLTLMVWGMAAAGIFVTYGTAAPYVEETGLAWLYAVLWVPWVAAAVATVGAIWQGHAISLHQGPRTGNGLLANLGSLLVFFLIAGALFVILDVVAGVAWTVSSVMTVTNGLFAIALASFLWRWTGGRPDAPTFVAGAVMLAAGLALGLAGIGHDGANLLGAAASGTAWFTAGLVHVRRG